MFYAFLFPRSLVILKTKTLKITATIVNMTEPAEAPPKLLSPGKNLAYK
jgi:hypothetical protein